MKQIIILFSVCALVSACVVRTPYIKYDSASQRQFDSIAVRYYNNYQHKIIDAERGTLEYETIKTDIFDEFRENIDAFIDTAEIRDWKFFLSDLSWEDERSGGKNFSFTLSSSLENFPQIYLVSHYIAGADSMETSSTYNILKGMKKGRIYPVAFSGSFVRGPSSYLTVKDVELFESYPSLFTARYPSMELLQDDQMSCPAFRFKVSCISVLPREGNEAFYELLGKQYKHK